MSAPAGAPTCEISAWDLFPEPDSLRLQCAPIPVVSGRERIRPNLFKRFSTWARPLVPSTAPTSMTLAWSALTLRILFLRRRFYPEGCRDATKENYQGGPPKALQGGRAKTHPRGTKRIKNAPQALQHQSRTDRAGPGIAFERDSPQNLVSGPRS